jgi:hypothetical protein
VKPSEGLAVLAGRAEQGADRIAEQRGLPGQPSGELLGGRRDRAPGGEERGQEVLQGAELGGRDGVGAREESRLALDEHDIQAPEVRPEQGEAQEVGHEQVVDRPSVALDLPAFKDPGKYRRRSDRLRLAVSDRAAEAVDHLEVGLANIPKPQLGMHRDRRPLEVKRGCVQEVDQRGPEGVLGGAGNGGGVAQGLEVGPDGSRAKPLEGGDYTP